MFLSLLLEESLCECSRIEGERLRGCRRSGDSLPREFDYIEYYMHSQNSFMSEGTVTLYNPNQQEFRNSPQSLRPSRLAAAS